MVRPTFRTGRAGGGLALVLLIGVLAACSGAPSAGTSGGGSTRRLVSTSEPAAGPVDSVVWNLTSGEPDTLDPPNAATLGGGQVVMNLCDALVRYDADYVMSPGLTDYDVVSPTRIDFTIRAGATFWDGTPVTADDVAYSLNRARGDTIVSVMFASVRSITATGRRRVTVAFSAPDEKFLGEMASIAGVVVQRRYAEKAGRALGTAAGGLMCSGPFRLDSWRSGDSLTIVRNDAYWDRARRPLAGRVRFTFVTDASALVQALTAGEIDGAYEIPPPAIAPLRAAGSGRLYFGPSTQGVSLSFVAPEGPLGDEKLRAAMQRLVDRAAIARAVFHGAAEPSYTTVTPATWPADQRERWATAYTAYARARSFDVQAAIALVKASGYRGQKITMAYAGSDQTMGQVAEVVQQEAAAAGITIVLQAMGSLALDQASYDPTARRGLDIILGSSFNSAAEPLEPVMFDYVKGAPYNYMNHDLPRLQELITTASATFDPARQATVLLRAQEIWEAQDDVVPLVTTDTTTFLSTRLAGAVTSFAYWSMPNMATLGSAAA